MFIAKKLKNENICEYLLYMWQIEDIIRGFQLNIDLINQQIISNYPDCTASDRKHLYDWYESLIDMMRMENVQEQGHLQINKNIIIDLEDIHMQLLNSNKVAAYHAKYFHVLPLINQLRSKSHQGLSDIELCFNFQYGILLLKMKSKEISTHTLQSQVEISKYMVLLAKYYHRHKDGQLDLED